MASSLSSALYLVHTNKESDPADNCFVAQDGIQNDDPTPMHSHHPKEGGEEEEQEPVSTIQLLQRQVTQQQHQIETLMQHVLRETTIPKSTNKRSTNHNQAVDAQPHYEDFPERPANPSVAAGDLSNNHATEPTMSLPNSISSSSAVELSVPIEAISAMEPTETMSSSSSSPPVDPLILLPQQKQQSAVKKVMLFIDGTWLYYSIHERPAKDCPLIQRYGRGWQLRYDMNWTALPDILSHAVAQQLEQQQQRTKSRAVIQQQDTIVNTDNQSHTTNSFDPIPPRKSLFRPLQQQSKDEPQPPRDLVHLEWVQSSVYTSYKADTSTSSYRYKLFQELQAANFDVHMMETVGKSEKCVDIQLAVEMLHYATTPIITNDDDDDSLDSTNNNRNNGAYDVALLLTGDKDFMPAMIRTRQKKKLVGLVSMRRGCNRALLDTEDLGCCDFDVIWLEDYLDRLVVPKPNTMDPFTATTNKGRSSIMNDGSFPTPTVSRFTLHKVISDFLQAGKLPRVQSRDLGRYLKVLRFGHDSTILDELKHCYAGLNQFLTVSGYYTLEFDSFREDSTDHSYWISLNEDAPRLLVAEAARTTFSETEKEFFTSYSIEPLINGRLKVYSRTLLQAFVKRDYGDDKSAVNGAKSNRDAGVGSYKLETFDYYSFTVPKLKQACRDLGLSVSGTKATLLDRLNEYAKDLPDQEEKRASIPIRHVSESPIRHVTERKSYRIPVVNEAVSSHLKNLMEEYLQARGGNCGSRDIGRYLNANQPSKSETDSTTTNKTALNELKSAYGTLRAFASSFPENFSVLPNERTANSFSNNNEGGDFEFRVTLKTKKSK